MAVPPEEFAASRSPQAALAAKCGQSRPIASGTSARARRSGGRLTDERVGTTGRSSLTRCGEPCLSAANSAGSEHDALGIGGRCGRATIAAALPLLFFIEQHV